MEKVRYPNLIFVYQIILIVLALFIKGNAMYDFLKILLFIGVIVLDILKYQKLDEMQKFNELKSTRNTFYSILILLLILFLLKRIESREIFELIFVFSILIKGLFLTAYYYNRRKVIKRVGFTIFILLQTFVLLSHGFSLETLIESLLPITILLGTLFALKWRYLGATIFFAFSLWFLINILKNPIINMAKIFTITILVIPVIFLGFQSLRKEEEEE